MHPAHTPATATAWAPATVANLGPGYDALGLALSGLGDEVTARLSPTPGLRITQITGDQGRLPRDAHHNSAGIAARETLRLCLAGTELNPAHVGLELTLHKGMPIGSGLGSSAASAAAAAVATHALCVQAYGTAALPRAALIGPCIEAEAAVSGRHADNVAPALLGGLILLRSTEPLDLVELPTPALTVVVVTPAFELSTRLARAALPAQVPLSDLVHTASHLAALVAACYTHDIPLLARSLVDPVITPVRAALIPGAPEVMHAARTAGALASSISGAGPSIFALCHGPADAAPIAHAMVAAFAHAGLSATALISPLHNPGATLR
jgi:homoserine kinase